ncbi:hypothetical protein C8R44DRAFT_984456 [Mycena epipterygia]|nr:hypothetical protein C8R44DRAFT_984456 [Mycena epipterygia]
MPGTYTGCNQSSFLSAHRTNIAPTQAHELCRSGFKIDEICVTSHLVYLRRPKASTQWLGQPHQHLALRRFPLVSSGLHTPAASVDLTSSSLDEPSTTPSVADLVKRISASKFCVLTFDVRSGLTCIVGERAFKAIYDSGTQLLTVTWTTDVHEGFIWAIQPLIQAAEKNKTYVIETNTRILDGIE